MLPPLPSLPPVSSSSSPSHRIPLDDDEQDEKYNYKTMDSKSPETSEPTNLDHLDSIPSTPTGGRSRSSDSVVVSKNHNSHETTKGNVDKEALAFLLRYESMVRQQEAEDMACWFHVRPLLEQIIVLGNDNDDNDDDDDNAILSTPAKKMMENSSNIMERTISYQVLERALAALELSSDVLTTDRQLMMVLRTLTNKGSKEEQKSNSSNNNGTNNSSEDNNSNNNTNATTSEKQKNMTLTWAEFLQCYKTVVNGMQTLQHLPGASVERSRARDRTLSILSLFQPPSTKLLLEHPTTVKVENHMDSTANILMTNDSTQWTANRQLKMLAEELGFVKGSTTTSNNAKQKVQQRRRRLQTVGGIIVVASVAWCSLTVFSSTTDQKVVFDDTTAAATSLEPTMVVMQGTDAPTQLAIFNHNPIKTHKKTKKKQKQQQPQQQQQQPREIASSTTPKSPVDAPSPKEIQRQPAWISTTSKSTNHHEYRSVNNKNKKNDFEQRKSSLGSPTEEGHSSSSSPMVNSDAVTMEYLLQQNPHLGTTMKYRMVGSAMAGGLTGMALAPTAFAAVKMTIRQLATSASPHVRVAVMVVSVLTIATSTIAATPVGKGLRNFIRKIFVEQTPKRGQNEDSHDDLQIKQ